MPNNLLRNAVCCSWLVGLALLEPNLHSRATGETNVYCRREGMSWIAGTAKAEEEIRIQNGRLLVPLRRNKTSKQEYRASEPTSDISFRVDGEATDSPGWSWNFVDDNVQRSANGELQLDMQLAGRSVSVTKHWVLFPDTAIVREWLTIQNRSSRAVRIEDLAFLNSTVFGADSKELELSYITGGGNFNGSQLLKTERHNGPFTRTFDSASGIQTGNYSAYLPLVLLEDSRTHDSMAVGWDYLGHWRLKVQKGPGMLVRLSVAGYDARLQPSASLDTPKAFTAVLSGDLDAVGNQLLDWQYRYLWDQTNPEYFAKTRWAVDWPNPWVGNGGTPNADNWGRRLALDLRYTDLLRESGGDILWDDAGWYDKWGSWNGPDWRLTTTYLQKHGMQWVLWYPTFLATPESDVAQKHPEWLIRGRQTLEQSIPETAAWQKNLLDQSVAKWSDFQWRYDIAPAESASDTGALAADQNFRRVVEQFKRAHPQSGVDACDGGGRWISYDLARFAESGEYTDGGVGPYSGYYTSLIVSPDKLHNVVDFDHTYYVAASDRTHLALDPTWYRDPGDGRDVEAIRKDWELYHYFVSRGVAGRWSHIFRPKVSNDDPIWYIQRMDASGSRGVIITKHANAGPEYFLVSKPLSRTSGDQYEGGPSGMAIIGTTPTALPDTGIYTDPTDGSYRYYGVPGEIFGPLNFKYEDANGEHSYVTQIVKRGVRRPVTADAFGMAFQIGSKPLKISSLGQYDPSANQGTYSLQLVRASDKTVLGSATLDMARAHADPLGFKYAVLRNPIELQPEADRSITVFPRGLNSAAIYDVRTYYSALRVRQSGAELMEKGITLAKIPAGELIFFNLSDYPGSKTDRVSPDSPSKVTKRLATNMGSQGVEIAWSPARDNNWISYYEVLKNDSVIGKSAKGTFYFDHSRDARQTIGERYGIRTVDGDGNRSVASVAELAAGEPESYQPLGDFAPSEGGNDWQYEQTFDGNTYRDLIWQNGGYEGYWSGSGMGRIGRIWMTPSADAEISRTFIAPHDGSLTISGEIEKDPSADSEFPLAVRILHETHQIWPRSEWATVPAFNSAIHFQITNCLVRKREAIRFVVRRDGDNRLEPIIWNPTILYTTAH